jgi:tRNA uridine 5-carbamoylmethylation protein Kti12
MKLILLYGPPAVGKLTVAKELAKLTGYKVFHNHLTVDLVGSIFPMFTKDYDDLVGKYRFELIEAAAAKKVSLIFTCVYEAPSDDKFIKEIVRRVEKHRGKVCFVQLRCSKEELIKRIKHPSRKDFRKMKKIKTLKEVMRKHDLFSAVPYANNLIIDNTSLSPGRTARMIQEYLRL